MCVSVTDGSRAQSCVDVTQQQAPGHVNVLGGGGCVSEYRAALDGSSAAMLAAIHAARVASAVGASDGHRVCDTSFGADHGNQRAYPEDGRLGLSKAA